MVWVIAVEMEVVSLRVMVLMVLQLAVQQIISNDKKKEQQQRLTVTRSPFQRRAKASAMGQGWCHGEY